MIKRLLIGLIFLGGISTSQAQEFWASTPDGVTQDNPSAVEFYPNPAVEYLSVQVLNQDLQNVELELYGLLGNKLNVIAENMGGDRYRFDVQDLESGYYLLVVRDTNTRFRETYKFLKK